MTVIEVPTINDSKQDVLILQRVWSEATAADDVGFRFTQCRFLTQAAVAFLGGLARLLESRGTRVWFIKDSLQPGVRKNLGRNDFAKAMWGETYRWLDNAIPYREDRVRDGHSFISYLADHWLGRGWVDVSHQLRDRIIERVAETYLNAFEHSASPVGVFTCGQHYPRMKQLRLSLVDFGVGIPSNVRVYHERNGDALETRTGGECMKWAFQPGNSTKSHPDRSRGVGLDLLRSFMEVNHGRVDIVSHDGFASVVDTGATYDTLAASFEGTLVNISIECDNAKYSLASENVCDVEF